MNEELKPVRCGCGGEAVVHEQEYGEYEIYCPRCFITTDDYYTEAEAIEAWNTAIGERTAKVEKITLKEDVTIGAGTFKKGTTVLSKCGACGGYVRPSDIYCVNCGARLEWE